jgi:hypothetical protein
MNNYKYAILLFMLFYSSGSLANHQQWKPIFIDDNFSYLLDDTTVYQDGYTVDTTIGILPHMPMKIETFLVASASYFIQANCINKSINVKSGVLFSNSDDESDPIVYNAIKIFKSLVPDTIEQEYIRSLCKG